MQVVSPGRMGPVKNHTPDDGHWVKTEDFAVCWRPAVTDRNHCVWPDLVDHEQLLTNQGDYIGSTSRSPSFVVVKMKTKANAGDLQSSIFNMLQCGPTQQATLSDLWPVSCSGQFGPYLIARYTHQMLRDMWKGMVWSVPMDTQNVCFHSCCLVLCYL